MLMFYSSAGCRVKNMPKLLFVSLINSPVAEILFRPIIPKYPCPINITHWPKRLASTHYSQASACTHNTQNKTTGLPAGCLSDSLLFHSLHRHQADRFCPVAGEALRAEGAHPEPVFLARRKVGYRAIAAAVAHPWLPVVAC